MVNDDQHEDHSLKNLLDLDGVVLVIDERLGYWVKFEVRRVERSPGRPHGIQYSLTLHDSSNARVAGFDNAHRVRKSEGPGGATEGPYDHWHRLGTVKQYNYKNAAELIEDFWNMVDSVLREKGTGQ